MPQIGKKWSFHLMPIELQFQAGRTVCVCSSARQVTRYDPWVSGVSQGVDVSKGSIFEMSQAGPHALTCLCSEAILWLCHSGHGHACR